MVVPVPCAVAGKFLRNTKNKRKIIALNQTILTVLIKVTESISTTLKLTSSKTVGNLLKIQIDEARLVGNLSKKSRRDLVF